MSPEALQFDQLIGHTSYAVSPSMTSYSKEANADRIRTSEPGESDHDDLLLQKLGEKGWGRLHFFRNEFSSPWGNGKGRPLSPKSQEAFFDFLKAAKDMRAENPSLFLTNEGHLEICWEDESGKSIQLEFGPYQTEAYFEGSEKELTFPNSEIRDRLVEFSLV